MRFEAEFLSQDLLALLGVPPDATREQVRSAYRLKARASHPDLNPQDPDAGRRMALLNRAARVLLDPALRADYERARGAWLSPGASRSGEASRSWFESEGAADVDWGVPEARPVAPVTPGQRAFRRRVRHTSGNVASRAQEALRRVGNEQRLVLAALCIALGSGLLAFARPSNAFWTGAESAQLGEP